MAKKLNKIPLLIGLSFLMAVVTFGILALILNPNTETTIGTSVLSLEKVEFMKSSSACYDSGKEDLWLYTVRAGGLGQYAQYSADPEEVSAFWDGKETTKNTFTIDTKFDQTCEYPIKRDDSAGSIISYKEPQVWDKGLFSNCPESEYDSKCGTNLNVIAGVIKKSNLITSYCFCIEPQIKAVMGSVANINNPDVHSIFEVTVSNGESESKKTFDTNGEIKGKIGNNVCAVWQGNLETGKSCPSLGDGIDVIPAYIGGKWKLLSDQKYNSYINKYDNWGSNLQQDIANNRFSYNLEQLKAKVNEINQEAENVLNSPVSWGTISNPTELSNAKVVKDLDTLYQYPMVSFYVKASWIGVDTPIAQPKILSATSSAFGSGKTGKITVKVENVGEERGEVDIYGTCVSGFDVQSKSVSMNAGDVKTIILELTGTTEQDSLKGKCTITAESTEYKDTKDVAVEVTGIATCTLGEEWCESGNAWICSQSTAPTIKENCKAKNQVCNYDSNGNTMCKSEANWCETHPDDSSCLGNSCGYWLSLGSFKVPNYWCIINNFFFKFKIAVAIVLSVFGALYGWTLRNNFNFSNRSGLILAVVLGLAVGYVAYIYFWLGLGILILFLVIKMFLPKI